MSIALLVFVALCSVISTIAFQKASVGMPRVSTGDKGFCRDCDKRKKLSVMYTLPDTNEHICYECYDTYF